MNPEPKARRFSARTGLLAAAGLLFLIAFGYWLAPLIPPGPVPPPPSPNGFNDLVRAAGMVTGTRPDLNKFDPDEIALWVTTNKPALDEIHRALAGKCEAPWDMDGIGTRVVGGLGTGLSDCWRLLLHEGYDAEYQGDTRRVADVSSALLSLSQSIPAHGTGIDRLRANGLESSARRLLARSKSEFDAATCSNLLANVVRFDATAPGFATIAAWSRYHEKRFSIHPSYYGFEWSNFLSAQIPGGTYWRDFEDMLSKQEGDHKRATAERRLLVLELALRWHLLESGKPAGSLSEVVPRYLRSLPVDPFTSSGFVYRPTGTNWLVYSIGPDAKDDGGVPILWPTTSSLPKGDIILTNQPPTLRAPSR